MEVLKILIGSGIFQLLIVCISIITIVFCFLRTKIDYRNRKVHLFYISGILTFLIIELLSFICVSNDPDGESIFSYISFASTLSSLILSIIAIIFTIVSNNKGSDVFAKIDGRARDIQQAGESVAIAAKNISSQLLRFERRLEHLEDIASDTHDKVIGMNNTASYNHLNIQNFTKTEVLNQMVRAGSIIGNGALLACCYAKNREFDLKIMFSGSQDYVYGYLVAFSTIMFIDISIKGSMVYVSNVEEQLEDLVKDFFANNPSDDNIKFLEHIQNYFRISDPFWKGGNNTVQ